MAAVRARSSFTAGSLLTRSFSTAPTCRSAPAAPSPSSADPLPEPTDSAASPDAPLAPPREEPTLDPESSSRGGNGFRAWLNGDGAKFRNPLPGRTNWLGNTPFPMNPSFNPLPPLSDVIKTKIFNAYTLNLVSSPNTTDSIVVRAVSLKFGVGMERVRAIIRLKELEKSWKDQGRTLQTELLKGMESHLGVKTPGEHWKGIEPPEAESTTVPSKNRTVFEMVDVEGGDTPVFLPLLAKLSEAETSPAKPRKVKEVVVRASRPGRAATVFKDVTGSFAGKELEATRKERTKRGNKRGPETTAALSS